MEAVLKRFEHPDESRVFEKGRFDIVKIGEMTIGRASYEPGWKWSQHVAPIAGTTLCEVPHIGIACCGRAVEVIKDGSVPDLALGNLFYIPPIPHDSWVVGDEPYVSLHFLGTDRYAK